MRRFLLKIMDWLIQILLVLRNKLDINLQYTPKSSKIMDGKKTICYNNINSNQLYQKNYKATLVFNGDCKFYESKCVVKVTESNVDGIKVGDKITFFKEQ